MEILFSDEFREDYRKIKDKLTRIKVIKQIKNWGRIQKPENPSATH